MQKFYSNKEAEEIAFKNRDNNYDILTLNNGVGLVKFPAFLREDGVVAAMTTRIGGVSKGRYATMNMSFSNGDKEENVLQNYKTVCKELNIDYKKLGLSHQTHTTNIRTVTQNDIGKGIVQKRDYENVDGLITDIKGVGLVTQFADCIPLLFYDRVKKVIAASHAGWRGTVWEIGLKTVNKMVLEFGCNKKDILAVIAPGICKDCYEVDDKVVNELKKIKDIDFSLMLKEKGNGKYQLDLCECNRQILLKAGVLKENIFVTNHCTNCNSNIFHSHRATLGSRGNLATVIALK